MNKNRTFWKRKTNKRDVIEHIKFLRHKGILKMIIEGTVEGISHRGRKVRIYETDHGQHVVPELRTFKGEG